jgi:uncharacterized membrane protein
MTDLYTWLKLAHIVSATILFGTGLGTAFQMWSAHRSGNVNVIATVARQVVWADFLFTTPAVIVQPLTGLMMIHLAGFTPTQPWLLASYALYVLTGACWIPVVWIQIRVRDLARQAAAAGSPLPGAYFRWMRIWFGLGWPAFIAVLLIFWLMVAKPDLI